MKYLHVSTDAELDKEISKWTALVNERVRVVKGYTRTFLGKPTFNEGKLESSLANLVTDAFVDFVSYQNINHSLPELSMT